MNKEPLIKQCICCWYDLLGYGKPFIDSKWNLYDPQCKINIQRIENIKHWFHGPLSMSSNATKLYFNDGAISNIDINIKCNKSLYIALFFLETIIQDYILINIVDRREGFPGVRGVLTCGHRFDYENTNTVFDVGKQRTVAYHPKEFQMNTAFSKAFIIEESGSKLGIKGPNLYIDKALFMLFQNAFDNNKNHYIKIQNKNNELIVEIIFDNIWFATITVAQDPVIYKNKGINTKLYRFIKIDSYLNNMAEEASRWETNRTECMNKNL